MLRESDGLQEACPQNYDLSPQETGAEPATTLSGDVLNLALLPRSGVVVPIGSLPPDVFFELIGASLE